VLYCSVFYNNLLNCKYKSPRSRSPLPKFLYTAYNSMYRAPRTRRHTPPATPQIRQQKQSSHCVSYLEDWLTNWTPVLTTTYTVFWKSDDKTQVPVTTTYLIRIICTSNQLNCHFIITNSNSIHSIVLEIQTYKICDSKKLKCLLPTIEIFISTLWSGSVSVCTQSHVLWHVVNHTSLNFELLS